MRDLQEESKAGVSFAGERMGWDGEPCWGRAVCSLRVWAGAYISAKCFLLPVAPQKEQVRVQDVPHNMAS